VTEKTIMTAGKTVKTIYTIKIRRRHTEGEANGLDTDR
jgi:hypothetical protein